MKTFPLILAALLSLTVLVEAALPPAYQSTKEFRALLDNPALTDATGSAEPIESITRDAGGFIVKTNKHTLKVDVIYEPTGHPGPAKFHLLFHPPEAL